mmetsp:Transcript_29173/g.45663  ORF Transcript_29173/g.45663 Transcript_29173/m.45663 type:complete len:308 (+) Transcript_29173:55-978(+)
MASGEADGETDASECLALQQRLDERLFECERLQAAMTQVECEKKAARLAVLSGIKAAKTQLQSLRSQLIDAKRWVDDRGGLLLDPDDRSTSPADAACEMDAVSLASTMLSPVKEEDQTRVRALTLQLRVLRHELARWKHQVEIQAQKQPVQENEILRLKAAVRHQLDILESTQSAVKHQEVENEVQRSTVRDDGGVSLLGGGHGSIEACAERHVRERVEDRNIKLAGKAKRLTGVVAAQQLLIQRLEKQLLKDELILEQKDAKLHRDCNRIEQLKAMARSHSKHHMEGLLGISPLQGSRSLPRLPAI